MIGELVILLSLQVDAQSTVGDSSSSCESSTLDEAVNVIREELSDARLLSRDELRDVKSACASNQQQQPPQQQQQSCTCTVDTSSAICE